ncbi:MAG: serine hydrolase domain-containing protein [Henriciella sp.]|nr:serine hydrolase domain-containing protein [Henriciella sp.]
MKQTLKSHVAIAGIIAAFSLAGCVGTLETETPAPAQPEAAVVDAAPEPVAEPVAAFSEDGIAALEARMSQFVLDGEVYGLATRLVHDGEIVSDHRFGIKALEAQTPIAEDTIYRIYSMTKPVTGVAMMMLWEEGAFALDDPITKFIPEFEGLQVLNGVNEDGSAIVVPMERAPTMQELMSHTAGFAYGLTTADPANAAFNDQDVLASPDLPTFIGKVADIPLVHQPGEAWAYSAAVDIQGHIIEQISGQTLGAFFEERIFTPLGMADTGFYVPDADYDRLSEVYGFSPEHEAWVPVPSPDVAYTKSTIAMESGGGGLVSTMDDYTSFAAMLLNGGELNGTRLLKEDTVDLMTTNLLADGMKIAFDGTSGSDVLEGHGFGLNFGVIVDADVAETSVPNGSYYWGGAAGTWFWIDPTNDLFFIGMVQYFAWTNPGQETDLRGASSELVYEALNN